MGSWTLVVHGHGQHDNNQPNDIENLTETWLNGIRGVQSIESVTLTIGSGRILGNADGEVNAKGIGTF